MTTRTTSRSGGTKTYSKLCPPWVRVAADEYRTARYIWEQEREAFSNGWATEMAEFQEIHPSPMFRDFLRDHAARRRQDGAAFTIERYAA